MKISGKEAYSVMLSDSPDIMNIEEMCSALSISKRQDISCCEKERSWA